MQFSAKDLVRSNRASLVLGDPHAVFKGVSIDTRTLHEGDLFFAIPGPRHDGHDHLEEALKKGASGLVVQQLDERVRFARERPPVVFQVNNSIEALQSWARYLRRQSQATFIGVTGSNGKTTTKEMIAAILSRAGKTWATRGNLNNHLGLPLTLSQIQPDHRYVVIEMGVSRPGDMKLLAEIGRPQISVITHIGKAHLEGLGSQEGVMKEKIGIFDILPPDGVAIINLDDPLLASAAKTITRRQVTFGFSPRADVTAESIMEDETSVHFTLKIGGQTASTQIPLPGRFQVSNALAAAAVAQSLGIGIEEIARGLADFRPVAMRMQPIAHPSGALLINDAYNANPTSVRASITSLVDGYADRPRWLVLGDMRELGASAREEHRALGAWLSTQALDRVFLYGRDTRFVLETLNPSRSNLIVARYKKKRRLLADLQRSLPQKPVVLFKASRSMKLEQVIQALTGQASAR